MTEETIERISAEFKAMFPEHQVIVLESDMGLAVVRADEESPSAVGNVKRSVTIPFPDRRVGG